MCGSSMHAGGSRIADNSSMLLGNRMSISVRFGHILRRDLLPGRIGGTLGNVVPGARGRIDVRSGS
ncbi:hypothetical protein RHRU231_820072 [Rhodococcus ruber]|uniref:Uncharacterized protein n=1 Tax=Rhodococcus ruber TaxID=1830 RepID=A0A098BSU4_9NOCA|nr:hypothetical protein RHRU231_820072 [Rhodococcus ruber]